MKYSNFFLTIAVSMMGITICDAQYNILNAKTSAEIGVKNQAQLDADNDSPLPYGYVHDRDILFGKIVWEYIDLNERMNFPLYYPVENNLGSDRVSLFNTLVAGILDGKITEIFDDSYFKNKKSFKDVQVLFKYREINSLGRSYLNSLGSNAPTGDDEEIIASGVLERDMFSETEVTGADIQGYKVVGMWYVDKRQAEMKYRIMGIAPMALSALDKARSESSTDYIELFWVYFPNAREVLHDSKSFNDKNSAMPISFDHLLNSRRFSSVIIREQNVFGDRDVKQYIRENALDQLLESNRIKEKIRDIEQDLWNY